MTTVEIILNRSGKAIKIALYDLYKKLVIYGAEELKPGFITVQFLFQKQNQ